MSGPTVPNRQPEWLPEGMKPVGQLLDLGPPLYGTRAVLELLDGRDAGWRADSDAKVAAAFSEGQKEGARATLDLVAAASPQAVEFANESTVIRQLRAQVEAVESDRDARLLAMARAFDKAVDEALAYMDPGVAWDVFKRWAKEHEPALAARLGQG